MVGFFPKEIVFPSALEIGKLFRGKNSLKYLKNWGPEWSMLAASDAVVFVDNHDNQRGHGAGGTHILTFKDPVLYKMANVFMLAHPYGKVVRVMSSYAFNNTDQGPPLNANGHIKSPIFLQNKLCDTLTSGWICEHRWREIQEMVKFRNFAGSTPMENWWEHGKKQIAFSRGKVGFVVFNMEMDRELQANMETGLAKGTYCDILSGVKENGSCTRAKIIVEANGQANTNLAEGPKALAIYEKSKL